MIIFKLLGSFFGNWKVVLITLIIAVVGVVAYKYKSLERQLTTLKKESAEQLEHERTANERLEKNYSQAKAANEQNALIISQLQADKQRTLEAVAKLNDDVKRTAVSVNVIKDKISKITVPPTKLSPYIVDAIAGVQQLRAEEAKE